MTLALIDLNREQINEIESKLEEYDAAHIGFTLDGAVNIGVINENTGELIAGACGCMTVYKIFYISTVFVDEAYRNNVIKKL